MMQIIGLALIASAVIILLRKYIPEFAIPLSVLAAAVILFLAALQSLPVIEKLEQFTSAAGISAEYIKIMLKALGICYITELAAGTCRDSGESSLASKVELAGRISVVVLSLPLISQVLEIVNGLVN